MRTVQLLGPTYTGPCPNSPPHQTWFNSPAVAYELLSPDAMKTTKIALGGEQQTLQTGLDADALTQQSGSVRQSRLEVDQFDSERSKGFSKPPPCNPKPVSPPTRDRPKTVTLPFSGSASSGTPDTFRLMIPPGSQVRANITGTSQNGGGTFGLVISDGTSQQVFCNGQSSCAFTVPEGLWTVFFTSVTDDIGHYHGEISWDPPPRDQVRRLNVTMRNGEVDGTTQETQDLDTWKSRLSGRMAAIWGVKDRGDDYLGIQAYLTHEWPNEPLDTVTAKKLVTWVWGGAENIPRADAP